MNSDFFAFMTVMMICTFLANYYSKNNNSWTEILKFCLLGFFALILVKSFFAYFDWLSLVKATTFPKK